MYFAPPLKGFRLELGIGVGSETRMTRLPGRQRSLPLSSAVWIECTNVTDRRTDGRTLGHSKDRAYAYHRAVKMADYSKRHCTAKVAVCLTDTARHCGSLRKFQKLMNEDIVCDYEVLHHCRHAHRWFRRLFSIRDQLIRRATAVWA